MYDETYHAFMLDHAAGTMDEAMHVAGELHVRLSRQGQACAMVWEATGGCLLDSAESEESANDTPQQTARQKHDGPASAGEAERLLATSYQDLRWRRGLSGVQHAETGISGGKFMRLEPSQSVPRHSHSALEATVVLQGQLEVDGEIYEVGDIALGVPGVAHKPAAAGDEPCICYVARERRAFWRLS